MAVSLMAVNAANLTVDDASSSSSSDTTMTVPTIDLNRGKSLRRKSEDLRGLAESDEEEDEQIFAVPIKGSRVMTDWVCSHCKSKLVIDISVNSEEPTDEKGEEKQEHHLHHSPTFLNETITIEPSSWRNRLWLVMEITDTVIPPYPLVCRIVASVGLLFIIVSIINFVVETHPYFYDNKPPAIFIIEAICMSYFSLELLLRLVSTPNRRAFLTDTYTIIDFVSILPFYVSLLVGEEGAKGFIILRILRLMRVFRIFKVTKYNEAVNMMLGSLKNSTEGLYLLLFLILLSTVIFSSAMYFVEREYLTYDQQDQAWYEDNTTLSPYQSILHASWWCLVTLTTVGYGDEVPHSTAGKFVAAATMLVGTLVIAFPMVIIGQNFQDTYRIYKKKQKTDTRKNKWKILTRPKNFDRLPLDGTMSHLLHSQSMIKRKEPQAPPMRIARSNSTVFTPRVVSQGGSTPKPPVKRISGISQLEPYSIDGINSTGTAPMLERGMDSPRIAIPPLTFRRRTKPGKLEKCAKQIESLEERLEALIRAKTPKNGRVN
eukprot:TRINITY_DN994_c0_g5_i1.p1 TRINITY_DN994_c0_g5~~TRINITY_DN994_c0_g5_i1.p1  ORF type:complete len:544 (+),score=82.71 TRINITY_DN994_c0_g5_i1:100-1731(+)